MNTENVKTNEAHQFAINLSQILHLRSWNKHFALQNLFILYTWKYKQCKNSTKTVQQCKKNKPKIMALSGSDNSVLPERSDIQDYIKYVIKKHEILPNNPPICIYISGINNSLEFKIKDGYKLELQTPETMNLFRSTKKLIGKTKNE